MRKFVIGMALASTAMTTPAVAREGQWYIELDFGPMLVEDFKARDPDGSGAFAVVEPEFGADGGVVLGYDFGSFRLETEASYRKARNKEIRFGFNDSEFNDLDRFPIRGNESALSFMANALFDFGPDDGLQGFVGGGVGVGRVDVKVLERFGDFGSNPEGGNNGGGTRTLVDGSDTGFAWQLLAGFRAPVARNWDAGVRYRFFNVENVRMPDVFGDPIKTRWRSHSVMGTVAYNFGGAEAPPPPPPPPPPAPPPPPPPPPQAQPTCNKGPYIVFFDWDRSDITPEASMVLDSAVSAYQYCDNVPIMLAGHADRSGSARYNVGLSERRNASVRDYLTGRGIPDSSITSQAFGESQPRVPTADGVRELQNRRVEITYGPGSGI
jgi:OmpA-OmpF porin, OOP family